MKITKKQRLILEIICEGIRDDKNRRIGWLDAQEICDKAPYTVSIHAMKFTLRFLGDKGMVEKCDAVLRRDRWVVPVKPTNMAYDYIIRNVDPRQLEHDNDVIELYL